jgi:hypothetical protein
MSLPDRFWSKVNKTETCWLWTAASSRGGYGAYGIGRKVYRAHRIAYEDHHATLLPASVELDHQCRIPACVNPAHMLPVNRTLNCQNRSGAQSNSTTGVRGVYLTANGQKYRVSVQHLGENYYGGVFATLAAADAAAVALRNQLHTNNVLDRERESA